MFRNREYRVQRIKRKEDCVISNKSDKNARGAVERIDVAATSRKWPKWNKSSLADTEREWCDGSKENKETELFVTSTHVSE